ncbi:response regulator [bacterium]|nr:response regulator [bacterium]
MDLLLVDDEPDILELLCELLEMLEITVDTADSGYRAVEKLKAGSFNYLITDVKMMNGDGMYVLEQIRDEKIDLSKIIVMTGYSKYPDEKFYELGASAVLQKPIDFNQLKELLEK